MNRTRLVSLLVAVSMGLTFAAHLVQADDWETLRDRMTGYTSDQEQLRREQQEVLADLFRLGRALKAVEAEVQRLEGDIAAAAAEEARLVADLAALRRQYQERQALMARRLRFMYSDGMVSYLEVLLGATDFSDFLARLDILSTIVHLDRRLMAELQEMAADVARREEAVSRQRAELAALRDREADRRGELADLVAAREERLAEVKDQRVAVEAALADVERIWEEQARPALASFGAALHELTAQMDQVAPDAVELTAPFGATVVISAATLNSFLARHPDVAGLRFRLGSGSADVVGYFGGIQLEMLGTFTLASPTVIRYVPREVRFFGVALPDTVVQELVQSGNLDVHLSRIMGTWRLTELTVEEGRIIGRAGM